MERSATEAKPSSEEYTQFFTEMNALQKPEEKLKHTLEFMRASLSREKTPAFRDFWDAKRLCLDLFKEKISPRVRTILWKDYTELSAEIRKLKEILDEQSSFAQKQILLAVEAIEKELGSMEERLQEVATFELPKEATVLQKNASQYIEMQKELELLNAFAGRLNGLRKELIQTQMRIRSKNQLFDRLSKLGNHVFPRRKELIQAVSELFTQDVEHFIEEKFKLDGGPYFTLKEEIKAFQTAAKHMTLNTPTFGKTREKLSGCWDQIKEQEKAYREKKTAEKAISTENYEKLLPAVEEFKVSCGTGEISLKQADEKVESILKEMRDLELGRDEVKTLKKTLFEAKRPLEEKDHEEREKRKKADELEKIRNREAVQSMIDHLLELMNQAEALSLDTLVEKWEALVKEEQALKAEGIEKAVLENRLGAISDHIHEKKWLQLREKGGEDFPAELHSLLGDRHKERRRVKEALEQNRKTVGGSGLSFEESMLYQELIGEGKIRLDTIETIVEEIEERLFDIEE